MAERKVLLNMVLESFDGLHIDAFDERLTLQKRIYLLQLFGIDLGYRYSWYVHGPYCSVLTDDAFDLKADPGVAQRLSKAYELSPKSKRRISEYKNFESTLSGSSLSKALELAASIHFLKHIGFVRGGVTKQNISKVLKSKGKDFSDAEIDRVWKILFNRGLIDKIQLE